MYIECLLTNEITFFHMWLKNHRQNYLQSNQQFYTVNNTGILSFSLILRQFFILLRVQKAKAIFIRNAKLPTRVARTHFFYRSIDPL